MSSQLLTTVENALNYLEQYQFNPLVSILMPLYNGEKYIIESMESIRNQTYENWELIIVDDGSTDNSIKLIKQFVKQNSNMSEKTSIIPCNCNKGIVSALNIGLNHCNGTFIARMDCDDICYPNRLQIQMEFAKKYPNVHVFGTGVKLFKKQNNERIILKEINYNCIDSNCMKWSNFFYCPLNHPTVLFNMNKIKKKRNYIFIQIFTL